MKRILSILAGALVAGALSSPASATLIGVAGPVSSAGTAPSIIGAPVHALDDITVNTGMEGFNEAQNVFTSVAHAIDGGGFIAAGTRVNSHMIFLNSQGPAALSHFRVLWTFKHAIIGIMSDGMGALEAASTFELGNAATNYTVTFPGSGPAAPFPARGMEAQSLCGGGNDGYLLINPTTLCVDMFVTEPGDWIRVVTTAIPEPATLAIFAIGLIALGGLLRRRTRV